MAFLNLKKKQKVKEEENKMSTLEQVKKAYADLSEDDKKSFHQSLKDRVDESVGEQEHLEDDRDSQSAKDRIDEAEGEKRAIEERREDRHEERQNERDERHEDRIEQLYKRLDELSEKIEAMSKKPTEAEKTVADDLNKITAKWQR